MAITAKQFNDHVASTDAKFAAIMAALTGQTPATPALPPPLPVKVPDTLMGVEVDKDEYPGEYKDSDGNVKAFKVRPESRKHFIDASKRQTITLIVRVETETGGKTDCVFGTLTPGKFSSGNHGLKAQPSGRIMLPDGSEWGLKGGCNLMLDSVSTGK